jgi:hypothetical protein
MPLNKRMLQAGLAKQSAKGSPASQPVIVYGVESGAAGDVPLTEPDVAVTAASRMSAASVREQIVPGAGYTTLGFSRAAAQLLFGVLGTNVDTGSGDPYTHTITAPTSDLPWWTFFGRTNTEYLNIADCKIDSVKIDFAVGLIKVGVVIKGCTLTLGAAAWTPTYTDDEVTPGALYSTGQAAAAFTLDGVNMRVVKGTIDIANGLAPIIPSYKVTPDDFGVGEQIGKINYTVVPDDLSYFKKSITGTGAGTTVAQVPYYAPWSVKFLENVTSATHDLTVAGARSNLMVAFPPGDPKGGAMEVVVTGSILDPRTGSAALTATLRNGLATIT